MSEIIKTVENITKEGDIYVYEQVLTRPVRVSIEDLNKEKLALESKIADIDYLLAEIIKLG